MGGKRDLYVDKKKNTDAQKDKYHICCIVFSVYLLSSVVYLLTYTFNISIL